LKTTSSWYWRPAFNCPPWPAFEQSFKGYARHRFVLMKKMKKNVDIDFQFLHIQIPDGTICDLVQNKFEDTPCEDCGVSELKGLSIHVALDSQT
jgi:hypothetical protein